MEKKYLAQLVEWIQNVFPPNDVLIHVILTAVFLSLATLMLSLWFLSNIKSLPCP